MKTNGRMPLAAACFLFLILLAGCAALSPVTVKQETLEERAMHYMQAQIDGKWDIVYSYFDSSSRAKVTRESYVKRTRNLAYRGFGIEEVTVLPSGDRATVKVKIDVRFMGYDFKRASQTQEWVKEQGEWFVKSEPGLRSGKNPFTLQEKKQ